MSKEKTTDSRRKLLKSLAVGSGAVVAGKSLPESWSKPVINSVVLPAHAETTDGSGSSGGDQTTAAPTTTAEQCNIAGERCASFVALRITHYITIDVNSAGAVTVTIENFASTWTGTGQAANGANGGYFNIECEIDSQFIDSYFVDGTIVCNETPIVGNYGYNDDSPNNAYTAETCS